MLVSFAEEKTGECVVCCHRCGAFLMESASTTSYMVCPECGEEFKIFGSGSEPIANEIGVDLLGKMPIDIMVARLVDSGRFEEFDNDYLQKAAEAIDRKLNCKN